MDEVTGTLEQWIVEPTWAHMNKYFVVVGLVYGDSRNRFEDGTQIYTSSLDLERIGKKIKDLKEGDTIYTQNSVYKLGKSWRIEDD